MLLSQAFTALLLSTSAHALNIDRRATSPPSPSPTPSSTVTVTGTTTGLSCTATVTITPLNCDPNGYLVQGNAFYNYSLTTGTFSLIKNNVAPGSYSGLQAIGYNVKDNYIYGYNNDPSNAGVFRLSSGGIYSQVNTDAGPSLAGTFTGDVDSNGTLWLYNANNKYYQYDVTISSGNYGKLLQSGGTNGGTLGLYVYDWVSFPTVGPYFYSILAVNSSTSLYRFNTANKQWSKIQVYTNLKGVFGAQFGVNNGTLLAQENGSGELYNFPIDGSAPFVASYGPSSSVNDGARCFQNPTVQ